MKTTVQNPQIDDLTLVLGGNGKTGQRVLERLIEKKRTVRIGSRKGDLGDPPFPPFLWEDRSTWRSALSNVTSVYLVYYPDLAVPGAPDDIRAFTELAVESGVQRIVLLSGRGEKEAERCEKIVQNAGIEWTIVRASWFNQNFSEGAFLEMVLGGEIALPAGEVLEPFIDADDIADVVAAALTEDGHSGQVYEVTGPRLMTLAQTVEEMNRVTDHNVVYTQISNEAFVAELSKQGFPEDMIALMDYLFTTVLDGRNSHVTDGVQRALGRPPRDFTTFVQQVAASGAWQQKELALA